jgi:dolichol kinase
MGSIKISQKEIKRKIIHILIGITGIELLVYNILNEFILFIIIIIGILISLISIKKRIPGICYLLDNCERKNSIIPGLSVILAGLGSLIALILFSRDIALASMTILTFADPISHIIGKSFGKTPSIFNKTKNIEGHISGALISSLFAMFFVPFYLAIIGAISAMIFELIEIKIKSIKIDDNFMIPIIAGASMLLLKILI